MAFKEHCDWLRGIRPMTFGVNRRSSSERMCFDAGVSTAEETYPVLIYSHGTKGFAETVMLMERYASHGFIVVALDHMGDTTANRDDQRTTEMYAWRSLDISAIIDWITDPAEQHVFSGRVDDRFALTGHSYGGYTTFLSGGASFNDDAFEDCRQGVGNAFCSTMTPEYEARMKEGFGDPRLRAIIPIAAGNSYELGPGGVANIEIPTMMITGGLDKNCSEERHGDPYWAALNGEEDIRVQLTTMRGIIPSRLRANSSLDWGKTIMAVPTRILNRAGPKPNSGVCVGFCLEASQR